MANAYQPLTPHVFKKYFQKISHYVTSAFAFPNKKSFITFGFEQTFLSADQKL